MPDPCTPGQGCYEAYTAALALTFPRRWADVSPTMRAAWEAAAQAVRAMHKEEEPRGLAWLCVAGHLHEDGLHCPDTGEEPPWGCPCAGCEEGDEDDA